MRIRVHFIMMFVTLVVVALGKCDSPSTRLHQCHRYFVDVPDKHWAVPAIDKLFDHGLLSVGVGGSERFNGHKEIIRFQLAMITEKLLDIFERSRRRRYREAYKRITGKLKYSLYRMRRVRRRVESLEKRISALPRMRAYGKK